MTRNINPKIIIFLGFLLLSFCLRFWTLFVSVLDKDESIYILGADSLLNGNLPYLEIWDNKPPGIFILFSLAMLILGNSIVSIRILSIIATTFTSYFLSQIGATLDEKQGQKIGLLAGGLYAIFSLHNDGAAANAEILFAPLVTGAFLLFFQDLKSCFKLSNISNISNIKVFMIGLILGIGMQIKYLVIMDVLGFILLVSINKEEGRRQKEEVGRSLEAGKLVSINKEKGRSRKEEVGRSLEAGKLVSINKEKGRSRKEDGGRKKEFFLSFTADIFKKVGSVYHQIFGSWHLNFSLFKFYIILGAGLILPGLVIAVIYQVYGYFDEYIYATITANSKYVAMLDFSWSDLFSRLKKQVLGNILLWLCLFWSPVYLWIFAMGKIKQERNLIYLILWFCCAFLAVLLSKRFYNHYFLQLLPPLCLISGYVIIKSVYFQPLVNFTHKNLGDETENLYGDEKAKYLNKKGGKFRIMTVETETKKSSLMKALNLFRNLTSSFFLLPSSFFNKRHIVLFLILIYPLAQAGYNKLDKNLEFVYYRYIQGIDTWDDREAFIAKYLRQKIKSTDYIYVVNYEPIIYYLVPSKIPTKYAFSSHLTAMSQILPTDAIQELDRIMERKPIYVLLAEKDNISSQYRKALNQYLEKNYLWETTIQNVRLYRRRI